MPPNTNLKTILYKSYRVFERIDQALRHRLTPAGRLAVAGTIVTAAVGVDTHLSVVYQIFTFLLSLLAFSALWSIFFRCRFRAVRELPKFGSAEQEVRYKFVLTNGMDRQQAGLSAIEEMADGKPSFEAFASSREPGEARRNIFDRIMGYHRWNWLVRKNRNTRTRKYPLPAFQPNESREIEVATTPFNRGRLRFEGISILRPDPLGLVNARAWVPVKQTIPVFPKRYRLPFIKLSGARRYQPGGVALASSIGDSEEFASMRDYRPGDPLRKIHWKSWAKTGKPIVKEFQDEFYVRHGLVLDTFHDVQHDEIFEEAVSIAASFACSVQTQESLLDLIFVGPETYCFTSGRSLAQVDRTLEILSSVNVCIDKPFGILPPLVLERSSLLSSCICILLTWDEERRQFIQSLKAAGVPLLVLVVTQNGRLPDISGFDETPGTIHAIEIGKVQECLSML